MITDEGLLVAGDSGRRAAEVAAVSASGLDGEVEGVDVAVGLGYDRDGLSGVVGVEPTASGVDLEGQEAAGSDTVVVEVAVECAGRAGAEAERGGLLPPSIEAVDGGELVDGLGAAQLVEQATTADGLELAGVTDESEAPPVSFSEGDQLVE